MSFTIYKINGRLINKFPAIQSLTRPYLPLPQIYIPIVRRAHGNRNSFVKHRAATAVKANAENIRQPPTARGMCTTINIADDVFL